MITNMKGYMNELSSFEDPNDEVRQMLRMVGAVEARLQIWATEQVDEHGEVLDPLREAISYASEFIEALEGLLS